MCQTKLQDGGVSSFSTSDKTDVYDRMLPKNDLSIMTPVRQWEKRMGFVTPLRWTYIAIFATFHLIAILWTGVYLHHGLMPKWQTVLLTYVLVYVGIFGVTAGVHRYWTHKAFKAKWPLQIILLVSYCVSGQTTVKEWVHHHRQHHKFSDTDADPHNARRGFFFSHVGWFLMRKHPKFFEERSKIDVSDMINDPLVAFHTKHFLILTLGLSVVLPTLAAVLLWNESWGYAILSQVFLRFIITSNITWCVNSFAHLWGNKPYDHKIMPSENWYCSLLTLGEGWHNYHHAFPWDYKAAELPYKLNFTTVMLDLFAKIGWAYDMKTASPTLVKSVALKRGDDRKAG